MIIYVNKPSGGGRTKVKIAVVGRGNVGGGLGDLWEQSSSTEMQATSLSTQVLSRTPRCRRTSSSSCSRSTGEGWADSCIGWHLLINSEATIEEEGRASDEHGVFSSRILIT